MNPCDNCCVSFSTPAWYIDRPVLSPPLLVVLIVAYCGNGRSDWATLRFVCTAGLVKFG